MNLREVRKKIKSVSNVKKITKAMQLVSAVKMKKAQNIAVEGRPYQTKLEQLLYKILPSIDQTISPLLSSKSETAKELIILISSNKGLCGAFNMNLFRMLSKNTQFDTAEFITVGKKGAIFATIMGGNALADFSALDPSADVAAIFQMIIDGFLKGNYSKVHLVYNKFISTLKNQPVKEQLLPLELKQLPENKNLKDSSDELDYIIEPDKKKLFEQLVINFLEEKIRSAVQNSEASEHSARMIAMKNATDNATDVIYEFTLLRNKLRQQKITYELLDMITAKESVEE